MLLYLAHIYKDHHATFFFYVFAKDILFTEDTHSQMNYNRMQLKLKLYVSSIYFQIFHDTMHGKSPIKNIQVVTMKEIQLK